MQYALLIHGDEGTLPEKTYPPAQFGEFVAEFQALTAAMREAGVFVTAMRLHTSDTATTQRVRNGQLLSTDGPFAETKEALAGLYVIECEDADQALARAARVPMARVGSVEVRPVRPQGG